MISVLERRVKSTSTDMTRSSEDTGGEDWPYRVALDVLRDQNGFRTPSNFTSNRQPRIEDLAKKTIFRENRRMPL